MSDVEIRTAVRLWFFRVCVCGYYDESSLLRRCIKKYHLESYQEILNECCLGRQQLLPISEFSVYVLNQSVFRKEHMIIKWKIYMESTSCLVCTEKNTVKTTNSRVRKI